MYVSTFSFLIVLYSLCMFKDNVLIVSDKKYSLSVCYVLFTLVLAFGAPKSQLGTLQLPLPLDPACPPITPIPDILTASGNPKGAILALDFHPTQRHVLCSYITSSTYYIITFEQSVCVLDCDKQNYIKFLRANNLS